MVGYWDVFRGGGHAVLVMRVTAIERPSNDARIVN